MEEKEEKILTKKDLKLKAQAMKLEEKQRKAQEKADIKAEKERIRQSPLRKIRNFFLGIIVIIILLIVGFYFSKELLTRKEIELSNEKMEQTYKTAISELDDKEYKKAIELLSSINENFNKYSEVKKKMKEIQEEYLKSYLDDADKYLQDKKYSKALDVLDDVEEQFKDSKIVKEKISEIYIAKINDEVQALEEKKDTLEVIKLLKGYDDDISEEVKESIDKLISKYKNDLITEIKALIETDKIKAKRMINNAQKILPNDKDIKNLLKEIE